MSALFGVAGAGIDLDVQHQKNREDKGGEGLPCRTKQQVEAHN